MVNIPGSATATWPTMENFTEVTGSAAIDAYAVVHFDPGASADGTVLMTGDVTDPPLGVADADGIAAEGRGRVFLPGTICYALVAADVVAGETLFVGTTDGTLDNFDVAVHTGPEHVAFAEALNDYEETGNPAGTALVRIL